MGTGRITPDTASRIAALIEADEEHGLEEWNRDKFPPFFTEAENEQAKKFTKLFDESSTRLEPLIPPEDDEAVYMGSTFPGLLEITKLLDGVEKAQRIDREFDKAHFGSSNRDDVEATTQPVELRAFGGFHISVMNLQVLDRHASALIRARTVLVKVLESKEDDFERLFPVVKEQLIAVMRDYCRCNVKDWGRSSEAGRVRERLWGEDLPESIKEHFKEGEHRLTISGLTE